MSTRRPPRPALQGTLLDDDQTLSAADLVRACGVTVVQIESWVAEGVIEPRDGEARGRDDWRFPGPTLTRSLVAMRLQRDLDINAPGVALALDLLDEIEALRARLSRR